MRKVQDLVSCHASFHLAQLRQQCLVGGVVEGRLWTAAPPVDGDTPRGSCQPGALVVNRGEFSGAAHGAGTSSVRRLRRRRRFLESGFPTGSRQVRTNLSFRAKRFAFLNEALFSLGAARRFSMIDQSVSFSRQHRQLSSDQWRLLGRRVLTFIEFAALAK